jgi:hypothetical protein
MRTSSLGFAASSLSLLSLIGLGGCSAAASSEPGDAPAAQNAALATAQTTRFAGVVTVGGSEYTIAVKVTASIEASTTQIVDCYAHASNPPSCGVFFDNHGGSLTTELSVLSAYGDVLATSTTTGPLSYGQHYLEESVSAKYLLDASAPPIATIDNVIAAKGVALTLPNGSLRVSQGYGIPSDVEIASSVTLSSVYSSFEDNSTAVTRLSRHTFTGSLRFTLPEALDINVGVVTRAADIMGETVAVALHRAN